MSIRVMTHVWDHSKASEGALLVLLAIADHAHDDGAGAWPSLETLGKKARMSERGVRYALRKLQDAGELVVEYKAGPKGSNRYKVVLTDPANIAGGTTVPGAPEGDPEPSFQEPGTGLPGDPEPSCPQTVLEPSEEPSSLLTPPSAADDVIEAEFIDEKPPTAQTLIAEWVDSRGPDDPPNSQVRGRVASTLKNLLDEGVPYDKVRLGFATWAHSGYGVGALASYVDNAGKAPQRHTQQQETNDRFARSFARAQAGISVFAMAERQLEA